MINDFDYEGIKLPVSERGYCRIEKKIIITSIYFVMKLI